MSSEFFQAVALRKETPGRVMSVFVKNCATASAQDIGKFLNYEVRIGDKAKNPSAPREIVRTSGQIVLDQVELVNIDIRKRLRSDDVLDRVDKITRALDCDHSSAWSNDFGKIDSRITGTGADIEHAVSRSNSRLFPAIQNYRAPGEMLHSQPLQFLLVRPENVIALL